MGVYLNPGNDNFRGFLKAPIYVDKTMMLEKLNGFIDRGNKYVCISRPRRFGKTIAGEMISAYYSKGCDSHTLFENLKIAKAPGCEDKLNKYNVIKIDMNSEYQNTIDKEKLIRRLTGKIRIELKTEYPGVDFSDDDSLAECILKVYSATAETFIILIDEYDVLVREQVPQALFDEFISFLNRLFKSATLRPAMVIELKHNKCAESAIDQIRDRKYYESLSGYKGNLLFVGVNYDEKDKTHECRIERFEKAGS